MKFENPMMKIEYLSNLDVVLEVSTHDKVGSTTDITTGGSTDFGDSDFGF